MTSESQMHERKKQETLYYLLSQTIPKNNQKGGKKRDDEEPTELMFNGSKLSDAGVTFQLPGQWRRMKCSCTFTARGIDR